MGARNSEYGKARSARQRKKVNFHNEIPRTSDDVFAIWQPLVASIQAIRELITSLPVSDAFPALAAKAAVTTTGFEDKQENS